MHFSMALDTNRGRMFGAFGTESHRGMPTEKIPKFIPRYAEALRRISTIMNTFSSLLRSNFWTPHVPTLQNEVIFASMFPLENQTLWTLVNRNNVNTTGAQIDVKYYFLTFLTHNWLFMNHRFFTLIFTMEFNL
jgi:hypothetical protein